VGEGSAEGVQICRPTDPAEVIPQTPFRIPHHYGLLERDLASTSLDFFLCIVAEVAVSLAVELDF